jgi:hypothetical protein
MNMLSDDRTQNAISHKALIVATLTSDRTSEKRSRCIPNHRYFVKAFKLLQM